jgi:hypothetical protein
LKDVIDIVLKLKFDTAASNTKALDGGSAEEVLYATETLLGEKRNFQSEGIKKRKVLLCGSIQK